MKNAYNKYIDLGYRLEKSTVKEGLAVAKVIRALLKQESLDDQQDARYFIERGRKEARQS